MRPNRVRPFTLAILCSSLLVVPRLQAAPEHEAKKGDPAEREEEEDGPRVIQERIRLYLQRHGDLGKIEPESLRRRVAAAAAERQKETPLGVGGSTWVSLGPTNGAGRMTAIAPHPTVSGTLYVGAAGGGVWKTTDSGTTWIPLTDSINDLSVGALAVAPSDPNVVYLGSGEGGYAIDFIPGIGFLKSTDAGVTWQLPASVVSTTFYRLSVHPTNALDVVAGTKQGGLRSTDGGATWTTVIARATYGDVVDLVRHPTDPLTLYASAWGGAYSSSLVSKVLKSTDAGATWAVKSTGLPTTADVGSSSFYERMAIAISATNPLVLYAATSFGSGNVAHMYKTTDGGESWADLPAVSGSANNTIKYYLQAQAWYDNTLIVAPTDANIVLAGGTYYIRSTDGGTTFGTSGGGVHVDSHDFQYQGTTLYNANDGGIWSSANNGGAWSAKNTGLVTRQLYALALDPVNRNRILTGAQDNGTSRHPDAAGTTWSAVIGGDGFECGVNQLIPAIAYGTVQFCAIERTENGNAASPTFTDVSPPFPSSDVAPFLSLLTVDPTTPSTIYTGTSRVWQSVNAGDTWAPLSTTVTSGPGWSANTVTAIAVARTNSSILMASQSTKVFSSTNGGASWKSVSIGPSVNNVEIDPANPTTAYAAAASTTGQSLYKSTDGGSTWNLKATGLPSFAAQVVRVDPTDSTTIYCGTDVGVYRSTDSGNNWAKFGTGIPNASVHDLRVLEDGSILRAATHGRGVWELQVPATGNTPPTASIATGAQTVAKGTVLGLSGTIADADAGDTVTGQWIFPDTWESKSVPAGSSSPSHTFSRAGVFPVGLSARDGHGALASASVTITVTETADACATPFVVPGSGPFPYTVMFANDSATTQTSDPQPSCVTIKPYRTLWLEFTPDVTDTYEISTCGTSIDTVLGVFTGAACGPYTQVTGGCNDDVGTVASCIAQSSLVTVAGTAGQTLRIEAGVYSSGDAGLIPVTIRPTSGSATAPRVTSLSRFVGPLAGGTSLVVEGANFVSGATVSFDGTAATGVTFVDSTMLRATTPAHAAGFAAVVVTNPDATSGSLRNAYLYQDPDLPNLATVSGSATICGGASTSISAALTGTSPWSLTWSDGFTQSGVAASPATRSVSPASTTTYTLTSVSDATGPGGASGSAAVTVNPRPATPIASSDSPVCAGGLLSLSTPAVTGAAYAWSGPNGFTSSSQNVYVSNVQTTSAGTYSVTITVSGCTSLAGTTNVVVNPDTAPPTVTAPVPITVDQSLCCGVFGGVTPATSAALTTFTAGGSATDDCAASPARLAAQLGGADVTSATCFVSGANTVTFRFQDDAGKIGTATSTAAVHMFGDVNLDAIVDPSDMVVLRAYFNFVVSPGTPPFAAPLGMADLNHDTIVDPSDLVILRAYFNFVVTCLAP